MASWKALPPEIQNLVFDQLLPYHILQCQLVCKNWHGQAQRRRYKKIYIYLPHQFTTLLTTLCNSNSNPGRYVQELEIKSWDNRVVPYVGLIQLLLLKCPNIERLDSVVDAPETVLDEIRKARQKGFCNRLKSLPYFVDDSKTASKSYYDTIYSLRSNLEVMILDENRQTNSDITTYSLLRDLNQFQNLRSLTLRVRSMDNVYQIKRYTENCPTLEELRLEGYDITDTQEDVRSIAPCPNIKSLYFAIAPVTENMLKYIIQAFPNLSSFTMEGEWDSSTIPNDTSNSAWVKFLVYLHTVEKTLCPRPLVIRDISGALTKYFNAVELNNIKLKVEYWGSNHLDKSCVYIDYPTRQNRSIQLNPDVKVCFRQVEDGNELPYLQLLRSTGRLLKSLSLQGGFPGHTYCLGQILQYCTSLVKLELFFLTFTKDCLASRTNTSIKHLQVFGCDIPKDVYPELSILLPSLSSICIRQTDSKGNDGNNNDNYIIEMLNTSFDNVTWKVASTSGNINIKVVTPAKSYYYVISHHFANAPAESSDVLFEKSLDIQDEPSLYIKCQDIEKLQLIVGKRSWPISFTEQQ
jgi:hypothetical protein